MAVIYLHMSTVVVGRFTNITSNYCVFEILLPVCILLVIPGPLLYAAPRFISWRRGADASTLLGSQFWKLSCLSIGDMEASKINVFGSIHSWLVVIGEKLCSRNVTTLIMACYLTETYGIYVLQLAMHIKCVCILSTLGTAFLLHLDQVIAPLTDCQWKLLL